MADTLPISVLLLARDETRDLEELLPTLVFAREVVVVWDPRGERATRDAAERLGARVFERAFDGFGPQRRFALEQCTQDWVLWIDADERLDAVTRAALPGAVAASGDVTGFSVGRRTWFLGRRIRFCGWQDERLVRLFRHVGASFDDAPVHERLALPPGRIEALPGWLDHHSYETWDACVDKMMRYARAGAEKAWRGGRRAGALDVLLRPPLRFIRQYVLQAGFLDGAHGVTLCALAAAQVFLKYAELWSRTRAAGRR
jgi:(heptosyl)LPS beta-1,4-glucosyltransferase